MESPFEHIISLGEACFVATILQNAKLRNFSSPFDWICGGDLRTRLNLLMNDFKGFADIEQLEKAPSISPSEAHDMYYNKENGLIFNHDFLKNVPLEQSYPEAMEKYYRRIDRLLDILAHSKGILLVYMDMVDSTKEILSVDALTEYMVRINAKFKPTNIHLLYYKFNKNSENEEVKRINKYLLIGEYKGVVPPDMIERLKENK